MPRFAKSTEVFLGTLFVAFCAVVSTVNAQYIDVSSNNPCPDLLIYQNENGQLVAYLKIVFQRRIENKLDVEFQFISPYENYGQLTLLDNEQTVLEKVKKGRQIFYKLEFPQWDVQPKVTKILINGNQVCVGPGVDASPGQTKRTVTQSSTFTIRGDPFSEWENEDPVPIQTTRRPIQQTTTTRRPTFTTRYTTAYVPEITATRRPRPRPQTTRRPPPSFVSSGNNVDEICGTTSEVNTLAIGGKDVSRGRYPWIAPMFTKRRFTWEYRCVANLISHKHLVTAGHCVEENGVTVDAKNVVCALGLYNIDRYSVEKDSQNVLVREIYLHESYKLANGDADIAILLLEERISFNQFIRPVCLWPDSFGIEIEPLVNVLGIVAGWGLVESGEISSTPKEVNLPIISQNECKNSHETFKTVTSNRTFCAGERNGVGPCNGDSGSGFVVSDGKKSYLRGVVSLSLQLRDNTIKCDLYNYIIFADIPKFAGWIRTILNST